jgi:hypothetical protein
VLAKKEIENEKLTEAGKLKPEAEKTGLKKIGF